MTEQEIRVAVAESVRKGFLTPDKGKAWVCRILIAVECGWAEVVQASMDCWEGRKPVDYTGHEQLPNYPQDLNAKYAAWEVLSNDEKIACGQWIMRLGQIDPDLKPDIQLPLIVEAFKDYFCEAFLRVKGKWRDA